MPRRDFLIRLMRFFFPQLSAAAGRERVCPPGAGPQRTRKTRHHGGRKTKNGSEDPPLRARKTTMLKKFKDLTEKEILAIAIAAEDEDGRIYGEFADALREEYPSTAKMFEDMRQEEVEHRDRLIAMFRKRFGEHIPLIRRENVKGFLQRRPVWLVRPLGVKVARKQAEGMELEAQRFYHKAATRTSDASTRELLYQLAEEERK